MPLTPEDQLLTMAGESDGGRLVVAQPLTLSKALREVLAFGIPSMSAQLILIGRVFAESLILARLASSTNQAPILAANGLIEPITGTYVVISNAGLVAIQILVGAESEQRQFLNVGKVVQQGWVYTLIVAAGVTPIFLNLNHILKLFGQDSTVASLTQDYFNGYVWGLYPILATIVNRNFFNGLKQPKISLALASADTALRLTLGYGLTFGSWGLPQWGVYGLGISGAISTTASFVISSLIIAFHKNYSRYQIAWQRPDFKWLKTIFQVGIPIAAVALTDLLTSLFASILTGSLKSDYLVAQGIATQYYLLAVTPFFGILEALSVLIRRAIVGNRHADIIPYHAAGQITTQALAMSSMVVFSTCSNQLFKLIYSDEISSTVINLFQILMITNGVKLMFDAIRIASQGGGYGCSDTGTIMKIGFLTSFALAIPLALILVLAAQEGPESINIAITAAIALSAFLTLDRFFIKARATITEGSSTEEHRGGVDISYRTRISNFYNSFFARARYAERIDDAPDALSLTRNMGAV